MVKKINKNPAQTPSRSRQPARPSARSSSRLAGTQLPKTAKSSTKPLKKPSSAAKKRPVSHSSMNRALQTKKRINRLADQIIDSANIADQPLRAAAKQPDFFNKNNLRLIFLGGLDGIGEKNMMILEYDQDAFILDCGLELGLDLPGVNYAICDTAYLEKIKGKLRGYVLEPRGI